MWRVLRYTVLVLLAVLVLSGGLAAFLALTAPGPHAAPGWTRLKDMPEPRGEAAMAAVEAAAAARVYVLGGISGLGNTVATVSVYDPGADTWSRAPDLPEARNHAAAAALNGTVHLAGGSPRATSLAPVADLWALPPGAQAWQMLPDMPEGRAGHGLASVEGKLYVVGGEGSSSRVLVYSPDAGWSMGAAMPARRDHLAVLAVNGEIWAVGGRVGLGQLMERVDIYDPRTDTWRGGPPLPAPMSAMAGGVLSSGIHIVGGEDPALSGGVLDRHYRLAPGEQAWEPAPLPVVAVHGVPGAVVSDRLVIAGGATRQGALSVLAWSGVAQAYP